MERQSQAVLAAILKAAVDAIIVIDSEGTVESVNTAALVMFGYDRDEVVGQNVKMLMPEPYHNNHDGYLREYHRTEKPNIIGKGREVEGRRADGTQFPIHLAVSRVDIDEQTLFTGIIRDISELKNTEAMLADANEKLEKRVRERTQQLEAAQAELLKTEKLATLGQVSGGIAHEIRNPLNAVRTSVYYLRHAKQPSPEKVSEHLERIDRQVSLIDNVVTALSDIARMPEPTLSRCALPTLVSDAISTVEIPSDIAVEFEWEDELFASADPHQLSIVFRNLVRNARDAMPSGGRILIAGCVEEENVVVSVLDTGCGIEEEVLRNITEPLYSTKARGMGLGLAICTAILNKNHGRLSVKSQVGEGTTFSVHLQKSLEQPQ